MNTEQTGLGAVVDFFVDFLLLLLFPIGLIGREFFRFFRDGRE